MTHSELLEEYSRALAVAGTRRTPAAAARAAVRGLPSAETILSLDPGDQVKVVGELLAAIGIFNRRSRLLRKSGLLWRALDDWMATSWKSSSDDEDALPPLRKAILSTLGPGGALRSYGFWSRTRETYLLCHTLEGRLSTSLAEAAPSEAVGLIAGLPQEVLPSLKCPVLPSEVWEEAFSVMKRDQILGWCLNHAQSIPEPARSRATAMALDAQGMSDLLASPDLLGLVSMHLSSEMAGKGLTLPADSFDMVIRHLGSERNSHRSTILTGFLLCAPGLSATDLASLAPFASKEGGWTLRALLHNPACSPALARECLDRIMRRGGVTQHLWSVKSLVSAFPELIGPLRAHFQPDERGRVVVDGMLEEVAWASVAKSLPSPRRPEAMHSWITYILDTKGPSQLSQILESAPADVLSDVPWAHVLEHPRLNRSTRRFVLLSMAARSSAGPSRDKAVSDLLARLRRLSAPIPAAAMLQELSSGSGELVSVLPPDDVFSLISLAAHAAHTWSGERWSKVARLASLPLRGEVDPSLMSSVLRHSLGPVFERWLASNSPQALQAMGWFLPPLADRGPFAAFFAKLTPGNRRYLLSVMEVLPSASQKRDTIEELQSSIDGLGEETVVAVHPLPAFRKQVATTREEFPAIAELEALAPDLKSIIAVASPFLRVGGVMERGASLPRGVRERDACGALLRAWSLLDGDRVETSEVEAVVEAASLPSTLAWRELGRDMVSPGFMEWLKWGSQMDPAAREAIRREASLDERANGVVSALYSLGERLTPDLVRRVEPVAYRQLVCLAADHIGPEAALAMTRNPRAGLRRVIASYERTHPHPAGVLETTIMEQGMSRDFRRFAASELHQVRDAYMAAPAAFHACPSFAGWCDRADEYHRQLRNQDRQKELARAWVSPVSFPPFQIDGFKGDDLLLIPFRDSPALTLEGVLMHHCVGRSEYAGLCANGRSAIYSVRSARGAVIGTLEIQPRTQVHHRGGVPPTPGFGWKIRQFRGVRNAPIPQELQDRVTGLIDDLHLEADRASEVSKAFTEVNAPGADRTTALLALIEARLASGIALPEIHAELETFTGPDVRFYDERLIARASDFVVSEEGAAAISAFQRSLGLPVSVRVDPLRLLVKGLETSLASGTFLGPVFAKLSRSIPAEAEEYAAHLVALAGLYASTVEQKASIEAVVSSLSPETRSRIQSPPTPVYVTRHDTLTAPRATVKVSAASIRRILALAGDTQSPVPVPLAASLR